MAIESRIPTAADVEGMAIIGRTLHDLRGIRFDEGEGGNAPADDEADDETGNEPDGDSTEGEESLGDAGKQALDRMKAQRNAERSKARTAQQELERLKQQLALKDAPAEEQALEQARAEARAEAKKAADKRILRSELKAAATGKLADPADAALYINLDDFTVGDDGDVDSDAFTEAITDLLERKPHLAAQKTQRFTGNGDQGPTGTSPAKQVTADELSRMSPEQIETARNEGRLNTLLGIKP